MQRTLETLAAERAAREDEFGRALQDLRRRIDADPLHDRLARLDEQLAALESLTASAPSRSRSLFRAPAAAETGDGYRARVAECLRSLRETASGLRGEVSGFGTAALDLFRLQSALEDARDREWDALGSNHVGMIFKSMEWRVERLAAEASDAALLVKTFAGLRESLDRLKAAVDARESPPARDVAPVADALEDARYAGFETRFRGREDAVRRQQLRYLPYFPAGRKVLDLGCGRGEFLEALRERGIPAEGADLNGAMVAACLDKGLACEKKDLFRKLDEASDGSLGGIFSSQVIEHLPARTLERLVGTARLKLGPGGALVLETVNPTSVFALVQIYYLDPSHRAPVHPRALAYLMESAGFRDIETLYGEPLEDERLRPVPAKDETAEILNRNVDALNALLFGPPNYAVVGRK